MRGSLCLGQLNLCVLSVRSCDLIEVGAGVPLGATPGVIWMIATTWKSGGRMSVGQSGGQAAGLARTQQWESRTRHMGPFWLKPVNPTGKEHLEG